MLEPTTASISTSLPTLLQHSLFHGGLYRGGFESSFRYDIHRSGHEPFTSTVPCVHLKVALESIPNDYERRINKIYMKIDFYSLKIDKLRPELARGPEELFIRAHTYTRSTQWLCSWCVDLVRSI